MIFMCFYRVWTIQIPEGGRKGAGMGTTGPAACAGSVEVIIICLSSELPSDTLRSLASKGAADDGKRPAPVCKVVCDQCAKWLVVSGGL